MVHLTLHLFGISHKVWRNVSTVELHTFNNLHACGCTLCFFNSDNAFLLNFLHSFSNKQANLIVVVGRDASNILNLIEIVANFLRLSLDAFNNLSNSLVDTAFHIHRVCSGSNILQACCNNCLSEQCSGCCSVASVVAGLRSNFLYQLSTHILELVFKFNFFCHAHTVLGDVRSTKLLFENHIATLRAKCHFHRISQCVNTLLKLFTSLDIKFNFFCHD